MNGGTPHLIPSIYLANYLNDFENTILKYDVQKKRMKKGDYLTSYGVINNSAYYIKKESFISHWDMIKEKSH